MNDRLWELLAKYWSNKISPEEKVEMESILLDHPDHWLKTGLMQQINWGLHPLLARKRADKIADKIVGKTSDTDFLYKDEQRVRTRHPLWKPAIAALLLLMIAGSLIFLWEKKSSSDTLVWQKVTTTNGMKTTLRLADGSELWMNAGSTLRYPENFNEKVREVYLTGEAYFKVKHDPNRPFIVHTSDMTVKVLGTEVDVRAYGDEDYFETSLIKGAVAVTVNEGKEQQQRIYLKPRQKLVVRKASLEIGNIDGGQASGEKKRSLTADTIADNVLLEPIKLVDGNLSPETAWKENTLLIENEPLQSLAKRLERWYGVKIVITDSSFAQQRFTGRADNVSLKKLLDILQMIKPFNYIINDKQVIIK
jgi:ferric-dicitrate binding protein FerR (iron transport regulator)